MQRKPLSGRRIWQGIIYPCQSATETGTAKNPGADLRRRLTKEDFHMKELTYTHVGDYYIPNLKLTEQPDKPIGKYGRMRLRYLKEYRPALFNSLLLTEKLYSHLLEIGEAAIERMEILFPQLMKAAGVIEELKADDQMKWVGLANALTAQAEEIILEELIFD